MKHFILAFIFLSVVGSSIAQVTTPLVQKLNASGTYKPAVFEDQNRIEKLATVFPAIEKRYREHAEKNHFPAIVYGIVVDGKLVFSGAAGILNTRTQQKATTQSLFRIASMTKSFTAMAIMKLQDDGKLNITDAASKYIPEMTDFVYITADTKPITIHNLLTMTAGFPEDNPWGDRQLEDTDAEFKEFLKKGIAFSSTPGQQFEYSNMGYAMLGEIVSRVSGMRYQDYITMNILKPLGMTNTIWEYAKAPKDKLALGYRWEDEQWKEEPMLHDGVYGAMGGLITTIEDFSKYVAFHLSAYPHRNEAEAGPVRRSSVREMHKPYMPALFTDAKDAKGNLCPVSIGYGFGLGNRQDCKKIVRVSHSGGLPGFGSEYRFYPEYGFGVIAFANRTYAGAGAVNSLVVDSLFNTGVLKPRILPASDILARRREQLIPVLTSWDENVANRIFAENFFLDLSRERWIERSKDAFGKIGNVLSAGPVVAENQLRGYFVLKGEKGDMNVYFTMSPERDPKIQQLELEVVEAR
jgi:CubicO group peptidase (beta-lactamase class C family)